MDKCWQIYGEKGEYIFLTELVKCKTEEDVREWVNKNHPGFKIKTIVEDE